MIALLAGSAVAGLAGSPHCVGMCGGFATACATSRGPAAAWHAGRLTTYATLGAMAGLVGSVIPGPGPVPAIVAGALLVWFAAGLAGLVPPLHLKIPGVGPAASKLLGRTDVLSRYALGGLTGLIPCGLVYAALAVPVALASPWLGALAMLAFGAGTVPALAAAQWGLERVLAKGPWARRALAAAVLASGLWSLSVRAAPTEDGTPACHQQR